MDTTTQSPAEGTPAGEAPAVTAPRRRGRPPGTPARGDAGIRLEGRTTKAYALGGDRQRTIGYLRLVVNQRHIPDDARVTIGEDSITIEWSE